MAKSKVKKRDAVGPEVQTEPEVHVEDVVEEAVLEEEVQEEVQASCRLCKHYPITRDRHSTSFVEPMRLATNKFRKTYCGTQPVYTEGKLEGKPLHPAIDCRGKSFEPVKK